MTGRLVEPDVIDFHRGLGFRVQGLGTSEYSSPYIVGTPQKRPLRCSKRAYLLLPDMCLSDTCCWGSGFRVQGFKI